MVAAAVGACGPVVAGSSGESAHAGTDTTLLRGGADASFARLQRRHGVTAGVVFGAARLGARSYKVGNGYGGQARSTIKVPLSYAVIARFGGMRKTPVDLRADIRAALRRSDNAATERLLASFGSRAAAARAVDRALARAGDTGTHMRRSGAWGATAWTLRRQQRYMVHVRCVEHGASLVAQMRRVTRTQRWGLGRLSRRPAFKGGWGSGADGKVRQLGLVEIAPGRKIAVAIFANANDLSFERAKRGLSAVARWLKRYVVAERVPEPSCSDE